LVAIGVDEDGDIDRLPFKDSRDRGDKLDINTGLSWVRGSRLGMYNNRGREN
jgi:hypothetical protein